MNVKGCQLEAKPPVPGNSHGPLLLTPSRLEVMATKYPLFIVCESKVTKS